MISYFSEKNFVTITGNKTEKYLRNTVDSGFSEFSHFLWLLVSQVID